MSTLPDVDARRDALRRRHPVWQPHTLSGWLDDCAERYGSRPMVLTDERWGEIGCAVVVLTPDAALTEDDVPAICRDELGRFTVSKRVVFYRPEDLPTTPTGKVRKFRLVQQLEQKRKQP